MIQVTCAIIIQDGKILLAQNRADSDHAFQWEFPGGKIHHNESEEACIIREIREELELEIVPFQKLEAIEHNYGNKQIKLIPFLCLLKSGEIKLNDHLAVKWCSPAELLTMNLAGADKTLLGKKKNFEILKEYARKQMDNS
ncbi:MAG: (deoxy)nucleoside triphosphate pyrophosphohydrolase [Draconibacterium sp.]